MIDTSFTLNTYHDGKKKHPKLFLINFANFDDILTLIQSNERKKYEVFVEKNFATKNQK